VPQRGHETETFKPFIRASVFRSVSIALMTSTDVLGHRYIKTLTLLPHYYATLGNIPYAANDATINVGQATQCRADG
jgi:hypothetical protein